MGIQDIYLKVKCILCKSKANTIQKLNCNCFVCHKCLIKENCKLANNNVIKAVYPSDLQFRCPNDYKKISKSELYGAFMDKKDFANLMYAVSKILFTGIYPWFNYCYLEETQFTLCCESCLQNYTIDKHLINQANPPDNFYCEECKNIKPQPK